MKIIFIFVAILFFLAGTEWLFLETPKIIAGYHSQSIPVPVLLLFSPVWTFGYGLTGILVVLLKKYSKKIANRYLVVGVLAILIIFAVGRIFGAGFAIRV